MVVTVHQTGQEIQQFLAITGARHVLLCLPYDGAKLLEFLDSCFHRNVRVIIRREGFMETAMFTESSPYGHMFLLLSHHTCASDISLQSFRNVQTSGLLRKAFCQNDTASLPCFVLSSNTLLAEVSNFYNPGRKQSEHYHQATGAEWLASCRGILDNIYDRHQRQFSDSSVPHVCTGNPWCGIPVRQDLCQFDELFHKPWDSPSLSVLDIMPYRLMNVLVEDFQDSSFSATRTFPSRPAARPVATAQTVELSSNHVAQRTPPYEQELARPTSLSHGRVRRVPEYAWEPPAEEIVSVVKQNEPSTFINSGKPAKLVADSLDVSKAGYPPALEPPAVRFLGPRLSPEMSSADREARRRDSEVTSAYALPSDLVKRMMGLDYTQSQARYSSGKQPAEEETDGLTSDESLSDSASPITRTTGLWGSGNAPGMSVLEKQDEWVTNMLSGIDTEEKEGEQTGGKRENAARKQKRKEYRKMRKLDKKAGMEG